MKNNKYIYTLGKRELKWINEFNKMCEEYNLKNHKNIMIYNNYFGLKEYRTIIFIKDELNSYIPLCTPFHVKISTLHQMKVESYFDYIIGVVVSYV